MTTTKKSSSESLPIRFVKYFTSGVGALLIAAAIGVGLLFGAVIVFDEFNIKPGWDPIPVIVFLAIGFASLVSGLFIFRASAGLRTSVHVDGGDDDESYSRKTHPFNHQLKDDPTLVLQQSKNRLIKESEKFGEIKAKPLVWRNFFGSSFDSFVCATVFFQR